MVVGEGAGRTVTVLEKGGQVERSEGDDAGTKVVEVGVGRDCTLSRFWVGEDVARRCVSGEVSSTTDLYS